MVAEIGVHAVGEVERRGAARERQHLAARGEDVDLVRVEVHLERGHERARILDVLLPLEQLAQPHDVAVALARLGLALLVAPVGGDAFLGDQVHLAGADLHLEGLALVADHRGVQRLVEVALRHRDVVLEAARDGTPALVHDAERCIGVLERPGDDAEGQVVEQLRDVDALAAQLLVDRVVTLDAEADLGVDLRLLEGLRQALADALDGGLGELQLLGDLRVQLGELVGIEIEEGEVLEIALDPRHPQPVGDRRVDLERLARDAAAGLGRQVLERLHVVQAVGELDQDDPDVLGRGQDHLAERLGLRLGRGSAGRLSRHSRLVVTTDVLVAADLGHAVHQLRDLLPELALHHVAGGEGILEHVVQQPHRDAGLVELEVRQQPGDVERVDQVGLAGAPHLVAVHRRGEVVDRPQELGLDLASMVLQAGDDLLQAHHPMGRHRRR